MINGERLAALLDTLQRGTVKRIIQNQTHTYVGEISIFSEEEVNKIKEDIFKQLNIK